MDNRVAIVDTPSSSSTNPHLKNAIENARRTVSLFPNSIEFAHYFATLLYEAEEYEEALQECVRALAIENPSFVDKNQAEIRTAESRVAYVQGEIWALIEDINIASISYSLKNLAKTTEPESPAAAGFRSTNRPPGGTRGGGGIVDEKRVRLYFNSMSLEEKKELMRIKVSDLAQHFSSYSSDGSILEEALCFVMENNAGRFWKCSMCKKNVLMTDVLLYRQHFEHKHMAFMLSKVHKILPQSVPLWAEVDDDPNTGGADVMEKISVSDDSSFLLVVLNEGQNHMLDSDVLFSWIFGGASTAKQLAFWKHARVEKVEHVLGIIKLFKTEFYHMQDLYKQKCDNISYQAALQTVEDLCLEEDFNRVNVADFVPQTYVNILKRRQEDSSNKLEVEAITNVLKEAESIIAYKITIEHLETVTGQDANRMKKEWMDVVDCVVKHKIKKLKQNKIDEITKSDTKILEIFGRMQRLGVRLECASSDDFRLILIPLVKSYLRVHLEDMALKSTANEAMLGTGLPNEGILSDIDAGQPIFGQNPHGDSGMTAKEARMRKKLEKFASRCGLVNVSESEASGTHLSPPGTPESSRWQKKLFDSLKDLSGEFMARSVDPFEPILHHDRIMATGGRDSPMAQHGSLGAAELMRNVILAQDPAALSGTSHALIEDQGLEAIAKSALFMHRLALDASYCRREKITLDDKFARYENKVEFELSEARKKSAEMANFLEGKAELEKILEMKTSEVKFLGEENGQLQTKLDKMEKEHEFLKEKLQTMEKEHESLKEENGLLRTALDEMEREREFLKEENGQLQTTLDSMDKEHEEIREAGYKIGLEEGRSRFSSSEEYQGIARQLRYEGARDFKNSIAFERLIEEREPGFVFDGFMKAVDYLRKEEGVKVGFDLQVLLKHASSKPLRASCTPAPLPAIHWPEFNELGPPPDDDDEEEDAASVA